MCPCKRGEHSYGEPTIYEYGQPAEVVIGRYCAIAGGVEFIAGGEHPVRYVTTYPLRGNIPSFRPTFVHIGNDVWIGHEAMVMGGVTVGDGAVLGARCLVREDVPPYAIVVGVPARVKRYRFTPEQIADLLKLRWWDWPDEEVARYATYLYAPDITGFLARMREVGKL